MVFGQAVEAGTIDGTIGFARFGSVSSGATNTASFYNPVQISYASGDSAEFLHCSPRPLSNPISFVGTGESAALTGRLRHFIRLTRDPRVTLLI